MGTDIHAWLDYDEEVVGQDGTQFVMTHTLTEITFLAEYVLFELLASVRDVIQYVVAEAQQIDPVGMEPWSRQVVTPIVGFQPKGLPPRLGFLTERVLLEHGYVRPDHRLYRTLVNPKYEGKRVYTWPPDEIVDHHSFSWLSTDELAIVADRFALVPAVGHAQVDGNWRRVVGRGPDGWVRGVPRHVAYELRNDEVDAVVEMMRRLNGDTPNRSRLVFWFDN